MERYKGRLIILAVLIVVLALVAFLLTRRGEREIVAGGGFSFITSIYGFQQPLGVGTDSEENIWASNSGASVVLRYDLNAVRQDDIETTDQAGQQLKFYGPYGIDVDEGNNKVYIADLQWRGVRVLDREGTFLYNLPRDPKDLKLDPNIGWAPYDIATYQERVYVSAKDGIYVFDSEGNFLQHWGTLGGGQDQFQYANGIATDPNNGNVYVADTGNFRVVALTPEGKVRWILGIPVDDPNSSLFGLPKGITVDNNSRIFVTDTFAHQIRIFDSDGKLLSEFGERGTADGQFSFPEGIAITPSNRMYLIDRQNNRLQIWQLSEELPRIDPQTVFAFGEALTVVNP